MNCNILVWNVRGLNSRARRDAVFEQMRSIRAPIVCLLETKLAAVSTLVIMQTLGSEYLSYAYLQAIQTRGGIVIAWRDSDVAVTNVQVAGNSVTVKVVSAFSRS